MRSHRKLILVLTDGEPSDIDVVDPRDLVEDARRAVLSLRARGIDVFGVTLDPSGAGQAPPSSAAASTCRSAASKTCPPASPSFISAWRGGEDVTPSPAPAGEPLGEAWGALQNAALLPLPLAGEGRGEGECYRAIC